MFELSQSFYFEAAHTLQRGVERNEADGSRRVHGHTYTARVAVLGDVDPASGMVVDLAVRRWRTCAGSSTDTPPSWCPRCAR
jgi:6-pyruvoyltetrahydropterin/6-carboxytetrahydropterin synthase